MRQIRNPYSTGPLARTLLNHMFRGIRETAQGPVLPVDTFAALHATVLGAGDEEDVGGWAGHVEGFGET